MWSRQARADTIGLEIWLATAGHGAQHKHAVLALGATRSASLAPSTSD
jgi:hypothetical protein